MNLLKLNFERFLRIETLDQCIVYTMMAFALSMGISRGGFHTSLVLLIMFAIIRFIRQPFAITLEPQLKRAFQIFFIAILISTLFSQNIILSVKAFAMSLLKFVPFFLVLAFLRRIEHLNRILLLTAFSLFAGSFVASGQGLQGAVRAKSFLGIMDFAGIIGLLIPFVLVHALSNTTLTRKVKMLLFATVAIALLALLFNGTRGVWVSTFIIVSALMAREAWYNRKLLLYILPIVLLIVALIFSNGVFLERVSSITNTMEEANSQRLFMWKSAISIIQDNWLIGVGLGTFLPPVIGREAHQHVHNNFLQVLGESGLIGLIAFVYLFGTILFVAYRRVDSILCRPWALAAILCTVELLMHGMFDYTFATGTVTYAYCFILGTCFTALSIKVYDR